jgi:DNA-binding XRE family transcriptional regulator
MTKPKVAFPKSPDPKKVRALRLRVDLTQEEAGALVYVSRRTWQDWERGIADMPPGLWELFLIKAGNNMS